jgi:hypothetical protein
LIGERQKQKYVYYRCQTKECPTLTIREEHIDAVLTAQLSCFYFEKDDIAYLRSLIAAYYDHSTERREESIKSLDLHLQRLDARLSRLTDAYLDGEFDKSLFTDKKLSILMDKRRLQEERASIEAGEPVGKQKIVAILELLERAPLSHETPNVSERRRFVENMTSNFEAYGKNVAITLRSPFRELAQSLSDPSSALDHNLPEIALIDHAATERAFKICSLSSAGSPPTRCPMIVLRGTALALRG